MTGFQMFDYAGSVNNAFEQGRAQAKQMRMDDALRALAANPDDPNGMAKLVKADPQAAMQYQQHRQKTLSQKLEQHREQIVMGAKIFRQFGVKDEASYQAARNAAQQLGVDISQTPPTFDPQYVQNVTSIADAMDPERQNRDPASVQEYEYAKGQGFDGSYMEFMEEKRGPMIASNGDGTFTIVPRNMVSGPTQSGTAPPPPPGFVIDSDGGPTPPASGAFR